MQRTIQITRIILMAGLLLPVQGVMAGPREPVHPVIIGMPRQLAVFWHDQRWTEGDFLACALYAQASVLEALGYGFDAELDAMRQEGLRDGWYSPQNGTTGLGQPLRTRGLTFDVLGTPRDTRVNRERALYRLMRELSLGHYPIVNINAQQLAYYRGSNIKWHTIWITGMRFDEQGQPLTVIANDSYHGAAVEYPIDEFLDAWGTEEFNYYAIFVYG